MTPEDDAVLSRFAAAVLDGERLDWEAAAAHDPTSSDRLEHLKTLAAIAEVHRIRAWAHLRILEPIGHGSSGTVYRAWDTRLDREVALKLVPDRADVDGLTPAIIGEGRLLARVQHPNVVTIHGADRTDGYVGLWMELVDGRTLEALLRSGTAFTADEVTRIGLALARALAAVHAAGLLHRDVKPHNVVRTDEGRVVLMDFGTGRTLDEGGSDLRGTPLYLAPEVFEGRQASVQSDIYSLGVLLYRLLGRGYPVEGATIDAVRRAHESGARADIAALRAPARLARVIARATDPGPERRYRTADDLCADLEQAQRVAVRYRRIRRAGIAMGVAVVAFLGLWSTGWLGDGRTATGRLASVIDVLGISPAVLPADEAPAIVVSHIRNLTGDPAADLMVEGLRYEVVRGLVQLDGLEVRSAPAASAAGESLEGAQALGQTAGANLVLEASLFKSARGLRLEAQLVRVADNVIVLPVSIESATGDALVLQDDLSRAIVNRLRLPGLRTRRRHQLDPGIQDMFLTAVAFEKRRDTSNARMAVQLYESVIDADPAFAPAYAGLASALGAFSRGVPGVEAPPPDPRMRAAAARAIELDDDLAEAHAAMANLYARDREWANARASFTRAIQLNPNLETPPSDFVLMVLLPLGEIDEALRVVDDALRLHAHSLDLRRVLALVQVECGCGLYDRAIENARWVLDRDEQFPYAELWLARALLLSGRTDEAAPLLDNKHWSYRGYLYAVTGRQTEARALVTANPDDPAGQMLVYGGLRDPDRAFDALVRAFDRHWWRAATWMQRPEVAILRGHPGVAALRKKQGLP